MSNLRTLAAFIFAFAILATVPSIRSQMRQPAEMPLALRDAILFTVVLYEVIMNWGSLSRQFDRCPYKHVFKRRFAIFDLFSVGKRVCMAISFIWFLHSNVWGRVDMWWAFCQYAPFRADSGYCVFGETVNENLTLEISKSFPLLNKNSRKKMG